MRRSRVIIVSLLWVTGPVPLKRSFTYFPISLKSRGRRMNSHEGPPEVVRVVDQWDNFYRA